MAISTYKSYLMVKKGDTYEKLVDISAFPDLGGEPENIDVTTLSDRMHKFIGGIQQSDSLSFDAFYNKEDFKKLDELRGTEQDLAVWFGASTSGYVDTPDGSEGKFKFKGEVYVRVAGAGVNEAVPMTVTVIPTTTIDFEMPA